MFLTDEVPARALNIEQAKDLSAYRFANENENHSPPQLRSTCQDDWQIDPDLCELPGQGIDVTSQVDDGPAIANEDDRYATVRTCLHLTNMSLFYKHSRPRQRCQQTSPLSESGNNRCPSGQEGQES
jgi:hypothetical protein